MIRLIPPLPMQDTAPAPPSDTDSDIHEMWEDWHDAYVDYLNANQTEHTYLRLSDEVSDTTVLIDRRGVLIAKQWDGEALSEQDDPDMWSWMENLRTISGWDPYRYVVLGPSLGTVTWQELVNEDTMPLRRASEDEQFRYQRIKALVRNASCGEGGTPRGETYICDTLPEGNQVALRTWKGQTDELHTSELLGITTSVADLRAFEANLHTWVEGFAARRDDVQSEPWPNAAESTDFTTFYLVVGPRAERTAFYVTAPDLETFAIRFDGPSGLSEILVEIPAEKVAWEWEAAASAIESAFTDLLDGRLVT